MKKKNFSLWTYLGVVIGMSWPFQIAYMILGDGYRKLLLVSMVMVAVATYICGRYIFGDGFSRVGWRWGKVKFYVYGLGLAAFLWIVPSIAERYLGWHVAIKEVGVLEYLRIMLASFMVTLIPAFCEEFAWRGYLLLNLKDKYSNKKALLIHALVTWVWHLPVVIMIGVGMGGNMMVSIGIVLLVSLIPTVMHAVVFAYLWTRSGSIAAATVYHSAFDEIRDSLEESVGLGALGQNWQMLILTILGLLFLKKGNWKKEEK